jgi:hypothetical protein
MGGGYIAMHNIVPLHSCTNKFCVSRVVEWFGKCPTVAMQDIEPVDFSSWVVVITYYGRCTHQSTIPQQHLMMNWLMFEPFVGLCYYNF